MILHRSLLLFSISHSDLSLCSDKQTRPFFFFFFSKIPHFNFSFKKIMTFESHNFSEKMQRYQDHIQALEEERRKIQVFQRELPLCLELVTQAIETCKQQLSGTSTEDNLQSGCSEQTSCDVPVFEEFFPIKRASSNSDCDEEEHESSKKPKNCDKTTCNEKGSKKSDWLRSVQLWNPTPDPPSKEDFPRKVGVTEVKRNGNNGAFHPFKKEKGMVGGGGGGGETTTTPPTQGALNRSVPPASTSSTADTDESGGNSKKEDKEGNSKGKARRCWSPELHRRFLQALQQLGGSHVATPKQIRELMKVDGLTNDEVKSHLQKYRLHTRRPSQSLTNNNSNNNNNTNTNTQAPQFVVVRGIWVPQEYASMGGATTTTTTTTSGEGTTGIYAPVAALPPPPFREAPPSPKERQHKSSNSDERGSHSEGENQSHSPTSSSTHM